MLPIGEWSIGIGCAADGVAPCFVGMVMPCIGFAAAFFAGAAVFAFLCGAAFFLAGAFFFAAGFAGIGMVMPGMFICAAAGAETLASASAPAARCSSTLTINLRGSGGA